MIVKPMKHHSSTSATLLAIQCYVQCFSQIQIKMNITLKRNYGFELIFEAENVRVTEDIEERIYSKTEDGKTDYKVPPKRDIQTHAIEQFVSVLDDMIYYREAEFDSSSLIERLFEKLPQESANKLLVKLKRDYEVDVE